MSAKYLTPLEPIELRFIRYKLSILATSLQLHNSPIGCARKLFKLFFYEFLIKSSILCFLATTFEPETLESLPKAQKTDSRLVSTKNSSETFPSCG